MMEQQSDNNVIIDLANQMINSQSFEYSSFMEAKHTVYSGNANVSYDRLTLMVYSHNLDYSGQGKLFALIRENFVLHKEEKKKRDELVSLFKYICLCKKELMPAKIEKCERPDFVLSINSEKIGVEVTELTTQIDQVIDRVARENFGKGKTRDEVQSAVDKHKKFSNAITVEAVGKSVALYGPSFDGETRYSIFSDRIAEKIRKYENEIDKFSKFVLLCDGEFESFARDKTDTDRIMERLQYDPAIGHMTISFITSPDGNKLVCNDYSIGSIG